MIRPYGALLTGDNLRRLYQRRNEIGSVVTEAHWEQQAQAFIARHWPKRCGGKPSCGDALGQLRWFEALAEQGWSVPHWPSSAGGLNWTKQRLYQWQMQCQRAQTPPIDTVAMSIIAPLLMSHGSAQQRTTLLAEIAGFQSHWCLGLLEPVDSASHHPTLLAEISGRLVPSAAASAPWQTVCCPPQSCPETRYGQSDIVLGVARRKLDGVPCRPLERQGVCRRWLMPGAVGSMWYSTTLR